MERAKIMIAGGCFMIGLVLMCNESEHLIFNFIGVCLLGVAALLTRGYEE